MKKKNSFFILFIFVILNFFINSNYIYASNKNFIDITSPSAIVIDKNSGRILYEKNANEKRKMASLTKVMTSILLVENCNLEELIEVPKEAAIIGGSTVGLKKGDKVSAKSLLYGMLLPSGNDCALTVGIHLGNTIENFANMMTNKAKKIGAVNTSFANPHGLDNDNHYTTAKDMAIISKYALDNKYINEAVKTKNIYLNFGSFSKNLNNTSSLLNSYSKADGIKTGFTNGANRCLVASASNEENRYIAVILGAETSKIRFIEAKKILEECFDKYKNRDISKYLNFYINIPVIKGKNKYYTKEIKDNLKLPLTPEEFDKIYVKQDLVNSLEAPVLPGTKLGTISALIDDEIIYEKEIYLEETILKKNSLDYIKEGLFNLFNPTEKI